MSIFVQTTKMDSQTIYHENGGVTITPAVYELGKHQIVAGGKMSAVQKGKKLINSLLHEELRQIEAYAKSQKSVGKDEEWEACL